MNNFISCILLFLMIVLPIHAQDITKKLQKEEDGFCWYLLQKSISGHEVWGAEDVNGNTIIPLDVQCNMIMYERSKAYPFFYASKSIRSKKESTSISGVYSIKGHEIIPLSRNYKSINYYDGTGVGYFCIKKDTLVNKIKKGKVTKETIVICLEGACDMLGKEIVAPKYYGLTYTAEGFQYGNDWPLKKLNVFLDENGLLSDSSYGKVLNKDKEDGHQWYEISLNGAHGVLDINGNEIIPLSRGYSSIYYEKEYGGYYSCRSNGVIVKCDLRGNVIDKYTYMAMQEAQQEKENKRVADKLMILKSLFEQANEIPNSNTQKKYDLFMQVINADPSNSYGYKVVSLNNIGVMYYNLEDYNNAKIYFEKALDVSPSYSEAQANLKLAKSAKRGQTWSKIGNALNAVSQILGTMSDGQTNGTYNSYQGDGGSYSGSSGGSSYGERTCVSCGGSGKCAAQGWADKYRCHGSGRCQHCSNSGTQRDYGNTRACSTCNGTKKCHYCGGSGRCPTCGGSGKR